MKSKLDIKNFFVYLYMIFCVCIYINSAFALTAQELRTTNSLHDYEHYEPVKKCNTYDDMGRKYEGKCYDNRDVCCLTIDECHVDAAKGTVCAPSLKRSRIEELFDVNNFYSPKAKGKAGYGRVCTNYNGNVACQTNDVCQKNPTTKATSCSKALDFVVSKDTLTSVYSEANKDITDEELIENIRNTKPLLEAYMKITNKKQIAENEVKELFEAYDFTNAEDAFNEENVTEKALQIMQDNPDDFDIDSCEEEGNVCQKGSLCVKVNNKNTCILEKGKSKINVGVLENTYNDQGMAINNNDVSQNIGNNQVSNNDINKAMATEYGEPRPAPWALGAASAGGTPRVLVGDHPWSKEEQDDYFRNNPLLPMPTVENDISKSSSSSSSESSYSVDPKKGRIDCMSNRKCPSGMIPLYRYKVNNMSNIKRYLDCFCAYCENGKEEESINKINLFTEPVYQERCKRKEYDPNYKNITPTIPPLERFNENCINIINNQSNASPCSGPQCYQGSSSSSSSSSSNSASSLAQCTYLVPMTRCGESVDCSLSNGANVTAKGRLGCPSCDSLGDIECGEEPKICINKNGCVDKKEPKCKLCTAKCHEVQKEKCKYGNTIYDNPPYVSLVDCPFCSSFDGRVCDATFFKYCRQNYDNNYQKAITLYSPIKGCMKCGQKIPSDYNDGRLEWPTSCTTTDPAGKKLICIQGQFNGELGNCYASEFSATPEWIEQNNK